MQKLKAAITGLALVGLAACDVPPGGAVAEDLEGSALQARLSNKALRLWERGSPREVIFVLRRNGTGQARFVAEGGVLVRQEAILWGIEGRKLCITAGPGERDCARPAISGDNITVRFNNERTGAARAVSGKIVPF